MTDAAKAPALAWDPNRYIEDRNYRERYESQERPRRNLRVAIRHDPIIRTIIPGLQA